MFAFSFFPLDMASIFGIQQLFSILISVQKKACLLRETRNADKLKKSRCAYSFGIQTMRTWNWDLSILPSYIFSSQKLSTLATKLCAVCIYLHFTWMLQTQAESVLSAKFDLPFQCTHTYANAELWLGVVSYLKANKI